MHLWIRAASSVAGVVLLLASCQQTASTSTTPRAGTYPGVLEDPARRAEDFMLRQHARGHYGGRTLSFDAVVQKTGAKLLVLLLTPYGSRALLIEQDGADVRTQRFIDRELPFDPAFILLDVQRVFIKGHQLEPRPDDGWHEDAAHGEMVRERWLDGKLFERHFSRLDGQPEGAIIVRYEGGHVPGTEPPPIVLDNGWFGYTLRFETSDYHAL